MTSLTTDPRPDLPGTNSWNEILRIIWRLWGKTDQKKATFLHKRLWTLRAIGAVLKPSENGGLKLAYQPSSDWDDEEQFNEINQTCQKPYAAEIKLILDTLVKGGVKHEYEKAST